MSTEDEERPTTPAWALDERERLWGAKGNGAECSHCRQAIDPDQVQLELVRPGGAPVLQFHAHCYDAWRAQPP